MAVHETVQVVVDEQQQHGLGQPEMLLVRRRGLGSSSSSSSESSGRADDARDDDDGRRGGRLPTDECEAKREELVAQSASAPNTPVDEDESREDGEE